MVKLKEISQEIILQEILDRIHCFLCHNISFDSQLLSDNFNIDPRKIKDVELKEIVNKILNKMNEWQRIKNIRQKKNDLLFNKFTTNLNQNMMEHKEENDNNPLKIGTGFVYEFIQFKYSNLKQEILSSEKNYSLDIFSWNDIYDLSPLFFNHIKHEK